MTRPILFKNTNGIGRDADLDQVRRIEVGCPHARFDAEQVLFQLRVRQVLHIGKQMRIDTIVCRPRVDDVDVVVPGVNRLVAGFDQLAEEP